MPKSILIFETFSKAFFVGKSAPTLSLKDFFNICQSLETNKEKIFVKLSTENLQKYLSSNIISGWRGSDSDEGWKYLGTKYAYLLVPQFSFHNCLFQHFSLSDCRNLFPSLVVPLQIFNFYSINIMNARRENIWIMLWCQVCEFYCIFLITRVYTQHQIRFKNTMRSTKLNWWEFPSHLRAG